MPLWLLYYSSNNLAFPTIYPLLLFIDTLASLGGSPCSSFRTGCQELYLTLSSVDYVSHIDN